MTGRSGVLLANLGTPDAATPEAVRRFLAEFLSDRRVVDLPPLLWRPVLNGIVLRTRPAKSAHAYRQVWTDAGSPLLVHTLALARALAAVLAARSAGWTVTAGMTYGRPSIAEAIATLREAGAERLVVLPLYPQYSTTTTAAVFDRVDAALLAAGWQPEVRHVPDYHADEGYLAAIVESLAGRIADLAAGAQLLFSFHGLPERTVKAGDPYRAQCEATARLVAGRLVLPASAWSVSYQSRVGFARWIGPYTEDRLRELAVTGTRRVIVCCPGFAVDCLETLEEIAIRGRTTFLAAGGATFDYVAALNQSAAHATALAQLATTARARSAARMAS